MKVKKVNSVIAILLAIVLALPLSACKAGTEPDKDDGQGKTETFGKVWSAPSTVKILQKDTEYENKQEAKLVYHTVRNEYESNQLVITAEKDIESVYLEKADLTGAAGTLSKDNIEVYSEKYVPINESRYFDNTETAVPDALIPIDAAREYGELKVEKGNNAVFWITLHIPAGQAPGEYSGKFTLTVDEEKIEIPVALTVNDYTVPETFSAKTLFSWRYERVGAGELDSSMEMMENYYEFFLSYGVSLQALPLETLSGEELIAALDKYYDTLSTFCLMSKVGDISGRISTAGDKLKEQVFALAKESSVDRNLFEKVMIYTVDEPDFEVESTVTSFISEMNAVVTLLTQCADEIKADKTGAYDSFKQISGWRDYVINIPRIVPISMTWLIANYESETAKNILSAMNCICPVFSNFDDNLIDDIYATCEEYDLKLWWYGCVGPRAPGANYHIGDTNLLSVRSITWLQKKYDILGNLYWDAAAYTSENTRYYNQYIDVYNNPYRASGLPAGDGFLTYPGAPYGINGPVTSMRLMALRDGMEDYEILKYVEDGYQQLAEKYGASFSAKACMDYFYKLLYYNGYCMVKDGKNNLDFNALRGELIETASWINNGNDFAFSYSEPQKNIVTLSCFMADGAKLTINGETIEKAADGSYPYTLDLNKAAAAEFKLTSADGTEYEFSRFIGTPTIELQDISDEAVVSETSVSEGSTAALAETQEYATDGKSLYFKVNGVITGDELIDAVFIPYAAINTSIFANVDKLSDLNSITMDIYNPGDDYTVNIKLNSDSMYVAAGTYTLGKGKNKVTINIDGLSFSKMDEVDKITFEFVNSEDGKTPASYELYVDNIVGLK